MQYIELSPGRSSIPATHEYHYRNHVPHEYHYRAHAVVVMIFTRPAGEVMIFMRSRNAATV